MNRPAVAPQYTSVNIPNHSKVRTPLAYLTGDLIQRSSAGSVNTHIKRYDSISSQTSNSSQPKFASGKNGESTRAGALDIQRLREEIATLKVELAAMNEPMKEHNEWLKQQSQELGELAEQQRKLQTYIPVTKNPDVNSISKTNGFRNNRVTATQLQRSNEVLLSRPLPPVPTKDKPPQCLVLHRDTPSTAITSIQNKLVSISDSGNKVDKPKSSVPPPLPTSPKPFKMSTNNKGKPVPPSLIISNGMDHSQSKCRATHPGRNPTLKPPLSPKPNMEKRIPNQKFGICVETTQPINFVERDKVSNRSKQNQVLSIPSPPLLPQLIKDTWYAEANAPVTPSASPSSQETANSSNSELLLQIREFKTSGALKKVTTPTERKQETTPTPPTKGFMQDALQSRFQAIYGHAHDGSDSSDDDEQADDSIWDD